jgi:hypothetical protein
MRPNCGEKHSLGAGEGISSEHSAHLGAGGSEQTVGVRWTGLGMKPTQTS